MNIDFSEKNLRNFGLAIGGFLIIFGIFSFLLNASNSLFYYIAGGIILLAIAFIFPAMLKPFYGPWMILSYVLGWLTTRVFLTVIFYVVVTPIGIVARLFGKKFLDVKINQSAKSYWNYRTIGENSRKNYEKQF